ncbi:M9 family metallopeptidase [Thalassomonas haliotis]|uniref:microbial collagenase n=1 Tax=Thalassomonas haliotis TaxID=485448 RepID=A0ABY7VJY9_9GAMM|nr:M9 family metallopeptidase [Thalassomonas haliotis]WDE12972.1 collagenase [Thalassomonas haliotis]
MKMKRTVTLISMAMLSASYAVSANAANGDHTAVEAQIKGGHSSHIHQGKIPHHLLEQAPGTRLSADAKVSRSDLRQRKRPLLSKHSSLSNKTVNNVSLQADEPAIAVCDVTTQDLAAVSGKARNDLLKGSTDFDCLEDELWGVQQDVLQALFNEAAMIEIAREAQALTAGYQGDNSNKIANFVLYLRVGTWAQWGNADVIGEYTAAFNNAAFGFLDAFASSHRFYQTDEAHGEILREVITLMGGTDFSLRYLPQAISWLGRYDKDWGYYMQGSFTSVLTLIYRGNFDANFRGAVEADRTVVNELDTFLKNNSDLIGHDKEYQFNDAAMELSRFLTYGGQTYESVKVLVKAFLDKYSVTGAGSAAWLRMADMVDYADADNCSYYGICNFKEDLMAEVLPITHNCSSSLRVRAQDLTNAQLQEICSDLSAQETYFHQKLTTNNTPVADDNNSTLELVIYDSSSDYKQYSGVLFGHSTDNGGIYLEGDPSQVGNIPRFFAYEAEWMLPEFAVWNLTHEYVHYLDGRFDLHGDFATGNAHDTVWWSEGLAEYISKKDRNDDAVAQARDKTHSLSQLLRTDYNDSASQIYDWGYLAVRFMFEEKSADIDTMLGHVRSGDYASYDAWLDNINSRYDSQFSSWLETVQSTDAEEPPTGGDVLNNGDSRIISSDGSEQPAFSFELNSAASNVDISISGGTGDADIYVRHGSAPTLDDYDYRPWENGNNETVNIAAPASGLWFIMVNPYNPFSDVELSVSWQQSAPGVPDACSSQSPVSSGELFDATPVCLEQGTRYVYFWADGSESSLTIGSAHGAGDISLYHSSGSWPSEQDHHNVSANAGSNEEQIVINGPERGWHYIKATGQDSGVTLQLSMH